MPYLSSNWCLKLNWSSSLVTCSTFHWPTSNMQYFSLIFTSNMQYFSPILMPLIRLGGNITWAPARWKESRGMTWAWTASPSRSAPSEREFFTDNLLVRIHLILEMILVDRPCATGVWIYFFQVALYLLSSNLRPSSFGQPFNLHEFGPVKGLLAGILSSPCPSDILI